MFRSTCVFSNSDAFLCAILDVRPALIGVGPIDWNYRCSGRRDRLNQLQRVCVVALRLDSRFKHTNAVFDKRVPSWFKIMEKE